MQIVAPSRSLTDFTLSDLRTMKPVPSYQLIAGNSMPSWTSRWNVMVVTRDSTSISPVCSAVKRCAAVNGVKRTFVASPSTAAAIARQTSTSRPRHCPCSSGVENPAMPVLTPHWTKPLRRTPSSVGVALERSLRAWVAGVGVCADFSTAPTPEHAEPASATHTIQ